MRWTLDEAKNPIPADNIGDYNVIRVDETFVGPFRVSTVFLGRDHGFGGPSSLWFETMIFGLDESDDNQCRRCATWSEAEAQHLVAVEYVQQHMLERS
jgi:hypothetical protein